MKICLDKSVQYITKQKNYEIFELWQLLIKKTLVYYQINQLQKYPMSDEKKSAIYHEIGIVNFQSIVLLEQILYQLHFSIFLTLKLQIQN